MTDKIKLEQELMKLRADLKKASLEYENTKEELENFLSQFTCVLDAPSCGCSEEELNDPKFDALYTEQDRLTKLTKTLSKEIKDLKEKITVLESEL